MFNIDEDIRNADWPKRTPDTFADIEAACVQKFDEADHPRDAEGQFTSTFLTAWADTVRGQQDLDVLDLRLEKNGDIQLETIAAKKGQQGQGAGSRAMDALIALADTHGRRIVLGLGEKGYQPIEDGVKTSSPARLRKFYKRFGFVDNKGRHKDYRLSIYTAMYRLPKGKITKYALILKGGPGSGRYPKGSGKNKVEMARAIQKALGRRAEQIGAKTPGDTVEAKRKNPAYETAYQDFMRASRDLGIIERENPRLSMSATERHVKLLHEHTALGKALGDAEIQKNNLEDMLVAEDLKTPRYIKNQYAMGGEQIVTDRIARMSDRVQMNPDLIKANEKMNQLAIDYSFSVSNLIEAEAEMKVEKVTHRAEAMATQMGIDPAIVHVVEKEPREFVVGGQTFKEAGHFDPRDGQIEINARNAYNDRMSVTNGLVVHELTHAMFQAIKEARIREYRDGMHNYTVEDKRRLFDVTGHPRPEMREELAKLFPVSAMWAKYAGEGFLVERGSTLREDMEKENGHSNYAKSYWHEDAMKKPFGMESAMNETLAEVTRYQLVPESWDEGRPATALNPQGGHDYDPKPKSPWMELATAMRATYAQLQRDKVQKGGPGSGRYKKGSGKANEPKDAPVRSKASQNYVDKQAISIQSKRVHDVAHERYKNIRDKVIAKLMVDHPEVTYNMADESNVVIRNPEVAAARTEFLDTLAAYNTAYKDAEAALGEVNIETTQAMVNKTCAAMMIDPAIVHVVDIDPRPFVLAGKNLVEAGHFQPLDGTIEINARNGLSGTPGVTNGLIAHEISHLMYETVTKGVEADFQKYLKLAITPDGQGHTEWYTSRFIATDIDGKPDPNGSFKIVRPEFDAEIAELFPSATAMKAIGDGHLFSGLGSKMQKENGHTAYAKEWWKPDAFRAGGFRYDSAINETLAEITRILHVGGLHPGDDKLTMESPWVQLTLSMQREFIRLQSVATHTT